MRRQPRLVDVRVEALDEGDFVWSLVRQIVPLMTGIVLDAEGRTFTVRVDVASGHEICLRIDGAVVRNGERVVCNRVANGSGIAALLEGMDR